MVHNSLVKARYLFFEWLYKCACSFYLIWSFEVFCGLNFWRVFHMYRQVSSHSYLIRNLEVSRLCNGTHCSNYINWLCKRWGSTSSHLQNNNYSHIHPTAHKAIEGFISLCLCYVRQQYKKADPKLQVQILQMNVGPTENYKLRVSVFFKCQTILHTFACKTPKKQTVLRVITCSETWL